MGELTSGSNARAMDTLNGKISNLSDAWHQFEDTLLNDKSEGYIKSIVEGATASINLLCRELSSSIDDQIETIEQRLAFRNFGAIGKAAYSIAAITPFSNGFEEDQAKLISLKKQKAQQDATTAAAEAKEKSVAAIKQTQGWLEEIDAANAKSAEEAKKAGDKRIKAAESAAKSAARAFASERESIAANIADLKFELDSLKLSNEEKQKSMKIRSESAGATAAEREQIVLLVEAINAKMAADKRQSDAWEQAVADANEFVDVTKAIQEFAAGDVSQSGFNSLLGRIKDDLDAGIISADQAKQKFDELGQAFNEGFVAPAKTGTEQISAYAEQAAKNMQSAFADFLFDPFDKGVNGMLDGFLTTTRRMAAEAALAQLMEGLFGKTGGNDGAGLLGPLFSAAKSGLMGMFGGGGLDADISGLISNSSLFANGGIMTSSGPVPLRKYANGGIANSPQLAMFGEGSSPEAYVPLPDGRRIPVAMQNGGGQGQQVNYNVTLNISTPNADSFRRSERQIKEQMARAISF